MCLIIAMVQILDTISDNRWTFLPFEIQTIKSLEFDVSGIHVSYLSIWIDGKLVCIDSPCGIN